MLGDGEESEWSRVTTGVKQGCTMSGFLFLLVIDFVMKRHVRGEPTGIRWNFATKILTLQMTLLYSPPSSEIYNERHKHYTRTCGVSLKINIKKTKVMRLNSNIREQVKIEGETIEDVETFTFHTFHADADAEMSGRVYL